MHENTTSDHSVFLTLTYNPDNLPDPPSVTKLEWQRYVKRLRKLLGHPRLKYFAVGEYGGDLGRPHYHAILYGINIADHTVIDGKCYYGPCLTAWYPRGFVNLGSVTQESCYYVASYLQKHTKAPPGCQQPFRLMSKGLGKDFVYNNHERLADQLQLTRQGDPQGILRTSIHYLFKSLIS